MQTTETQAQIEKQQEVDSKIRRLFKDGMLIQIHVSLWGMSHTLSEDDLDIIDTPEIFRLGKKYLIDPSVYNGFKRIESKARRYLKENSHKFPAADAHFVPKTKLFDVLGNISSMIEEFNIMKDHFLRNYETNLDPEGKPYLDGVGKPLLGYKDQTLAKYPDLADKLRPCYPTLETISGRFNMSYSMFQISLPEELREVGFDELIGIKEREDQAYTDAKNKASEMYRANLDRASKQMEDFVKSSIENNRQPLMEIIKLINYKLQKKEVVSESNIKMFKRVASQFRDLDIANDSEVNNMINAIEANLNGSYNYEEDESARTSLQTHVHQAMETIKNMSDVDKKTGEYFRRIVVD